jgi:VAD1 Analog of StAR-related lipid transfer domain
MSMEKFGSYIFESFSKKQESTNTFYGSEGDLASLQKGPVGDDHDDDSTVVHFDDSDFMPSNWTSAVEYIPPVGMAVVAGGLLFMAPIVFVGGILTACTALGAVHAAQVSYDSCLHGNLSQIDDNDKETSPTDKIVPSKPDKGSPMDDVAEVTIVTDGTDKAPTKATQVTSSHSRLPQDPSMLETCEQALEWVNQYYPPLAYKNVDNLEFKGLNALEYFDVFLADDAPYTFEVLQRKRQDKNIRYGKWETLTGVTQPSLVSAAATLPSPKNEEGSKYHNHLKERVLHFDAKTNSGFLGPPYATTTKVQRCLAANKRLIVIESKTTTKNIPFCDRFYVLERWLITSQKREDQYVSTMSVSCQVVFSQSCSFESIIVSKSQDTVTEIATKWNEIAQKALQRTEEARKERLLHDRENANPRRSTAAAELPIQPTDCSQSAQEKDCDIEVERLTSSSSRIMGEEHLIVSSKEVDSDGRPPSAQRSSAVRRSISRSLSGLIKRRQSNPA